MPTYSPDGEEYRTRVHRGAKPEDQDFHPSEKLFRRYKEKDLVLGRPTPLSGLQFRDDSGHSVNRGKYSEPQDVLEPDCCNGMRRDDCVVLTILVSDVPDSLVCEVTGRSYSFRPKHTPEDHCYAHSEIWCNRSGSIVAPYESPTKNVKDAFRIHLLKRFLDDGREPLSFDSLG